MIRYEDVKNNPEINHYIKAADSLLAEIGYTEHSFAHVGSVAEKASDILLALGSDPREAELARIAGYMHDIGNMINRRDHSQTGALIAFRILDKMGMDPSEIATVTSAIGNHDEGTGSPVSAVAAAIILADKSDVRRTRVRNSDNLAFDIHDRVNYSVIHSSLNVCSEKKEAELSLTVDTSVGSIMEFFEIFLERMKLCRSAALKLGLAFRLTINGVSFI